jgi:hypothetical protein
MFYFSGKLNIINVVISDLNKNHKIYFLTTMLFSGATLILQQLQTWQKKKKGMKVIAKI